VYNRDTVNTRYIIREVIWTSTKRRMYRNTGEQHKVLCVWAGSGIHKSAFPNGKLALLSPKRQLVKVVHQPVQSATPKLTMHMLECVFLTGCTALFIFDQSSAHASLGPDVLHACHRQGRSPTDTCCYDYSSELPRTIFFFYLIYPSFSTTHTYLQTTPFHPVLPVTQTLMVYFHFYCSSLCIVSYLSFHMVDIPIAPFHVLLFGSWTPDPLPIYLVVDRPLWIAL